MKSTKKSVVLDHFIQADKMVQIDLVTIKKLLTNVNSLNQVF